MPRSHLASAALRVGAVVNVSAMIVLGSAGAMLADTLKEECYRVACPMAGPTADRLRHERAAAKPTPANLAALVADLIAARLPASPIALPWHHQNPVRTTYPRRWPAARSIGSLNALDRFQAPGPDRVQLGAVHHCAAPSPKDRLRTAVQVEPIRTAATELLMR